MNWAYLAGFIDGEGCIYVPPEVVKADGSVIHFVGLYIYQKDPQILYKIKSFLIENGCRIVSLANHFKGREMWRLTVANKHDLEIALSGVLPYLYIKKIHASKALDILANRHGCLNEIPIPRIECGTLRNSGKVILKVDASQSSHQPKA